MNDDLYELNKKFAENQKERNTCGMADCHAPKVGEVPTEVGIDIAVCVYHQLISYFPEDVREEKAQEWYDRSFEQIKEDWEEYNRAIEGENGE